MQKTTPRPWIVGKLDLKGPRNAIMQQPQSGRYRALAVCDTADDATDEGNAELIVAAVNEYRGQGFAANCVILSCDFHTDKRYSAFYDMHAPSLNGFTGIYDYIIRMAEALTAFEEEAQDTWERFDWVEVSETFVSEIFKATVDRFSLMPEPRAALDAAINSINAKEAARK